MKKLGGLLACAVFCLFVANVFAESPSQSNYLAFDEVHYPGHQEQLIGYVGIGPYFVPKESSLAIDNAGEIYVIENGNGTIGDTIFAAYNQTSYYYTPFAWVKNSINKIVAIDFDNAGNMYCVLTEGTQPNFFRRIILRITGFPVLSVPDIGGGKGPKK